MNNDVSAPHRLPKLKLRLPGINLNRWLSEHVVVFSQAVVRTAVCAWLFSIGSLVTVADRPNIIFVLCDDLGAGDIGVLWQNGREGKQKFSTPNMDRFAKEGMILSRHYCPAPSCMASRSSLMTGRHQGHCARRNTQFDAELPDVHTLGSVLKQAGYATAAIGKWGMAGGPHQLSIKPVRGDRSPKTNPSHPTLRGFDYFFGYTAHRDAHYHYPKLGNRPLYDGFVDVTDRLAKCYSTDLFTARAKKWIVDHHKTNPKQPFFTYLCYTAPHAGLRIPTTSHLTAKGNYPTGGGFSGGVQWLDDAANGQINTAKGAVDKGMHPDVAKAVGDDGKPWPDHARRHATMVRRLDDALADLIQLLKDLKIDDRTLVVLTSDNGTLREAGLDKVGIYQPDYLDTFGRYDGIKLDLWEGGVRMPTMVRWPAVIQAGSESTAAFQFHDWMATFCDLSGVPAPAVSDGVSMVPTLTGKGEQPRGTVYSEFLVGQATPNYVEFEASRRGRPHGQMQSVLIGDYKGVRVNLKNHQSAFEVYHTLNDPKETVNLAGKPGAPTQQEFQAAVLRSRRSDAFAKRPYDDALIPALPQLATRPGLIRREYAGNFDWVPQFDQREPSGQDEVVGLDAASGAQQFTGYLRVPKSGVYHFALTTNGKAVVRLHDALLVDADSQYTAGSKALSGEIALQAGLHPIQINYLAAKDAAKLSLQWRAPGAKMKHIPAVQYRAARKNDLGAESGFSAAQTGAAAFRIPEGLSIDVFAAEPQLINPIAICLDEQGRVYVAEDHRFLAGTPENRSHHFMLEDDLQITTLADRLAMQKKWAHKFDKGIDWFTQKSDIVRRLEDKDGDGRADVSHVFADGFDGPLDGLGSGLIARDGKVWYTCIPNLWLLEDKNGDGKAEDKKALLTGFGVNAAFYGHDLHGLVWGVDGKLYFSVGDRGAHVETKEGTTMSNPRRGAVYRCNPDGTELERIHQGLRNPQELAVDQYGNVFADDNNCDKGDHSRLVYVVPGGDSGWNMAYQHIAEPYLTGPWHAEGMWHLQHDLQPAFIVPPVGKIGDGPSGFVFSSGTSLPPRYRNHFFYCNYKGNIGGVESFAVKGKGAGFTIEDHHDFCKPIKASDVEFGYDGKMYVADYPTNPFKRDTSGGRIYTIFDKTRLSDPVIAETRTLFKKGFRHRTTKELASLLHHDDMRVRLRAQFALAQRGNASVEVFTGIAIGDDNQLARLHAIWGLGQIGRTVPTKKTLAAIVALLKDNDSEVRAQTARVLGDAHYGAAASEIANLLTDKTPRVRFLAALALGSLRSRNAGERIISMLRENDGNDRYLTHAGVVALEQIGDRELVQQWAGDQSAAVRMAVLLVQRRWSDPRIDQFLSDAQLEIVTEAARAINDLPLTTGRDKLANLAERFRNASGENVVPLMRRIINANLQLGSRTNVEAVIGIATSVKQPMVIRTEAVSALSVWQGPTKRDRVTGFWRPIAARDPSPVRDVVQNSASKLLANAPADLLVDVTKLLTALGVKTDDHAFAAWVADSNRSADVRIAAFRLLEKQKYGKLSEIIDALLVADSAELRAEARDLLASRDEARATSIFSKLLDDQNSEVTEKQRAIASLARLNSPAAGQALDDWADRLRQGKAPASLQLDLIEAFTAPSNTQSNTQSNTPSNASRQAAVRQFNASADASDPLAAYRVALTGGNAKTGRDIFVGHVTAQCIRCHKIDGSGGSAGPDLSKVASPEWKLDRRHLLESIVLPGAKIAKGFGTVSILLEDGRIVVGTIKAEDAQALTLVTPENKTIRIDRDNVEQQTATRSAMPEMTKALTLREIRDLVEYLSTLEKTTMPQD